MMSRWAVLGIAVAVGLISILPYLYAAQKVGPVGEEKIPYYLHDSELIYLSRIREVGEGHFSASSPIFADHKQTPAKQQPFAEWTYAILALGNTEYIPSVAFATKFFFPAVLFILVYLVALGLLELLWPRKEWLREHQLVSIVLGVVVVLGYDFHNLGTIRQIITGEYSAPILSLWTRIVHPITGALGLFALLLYIVRLVKGSVWTYTLGAGVVLGLMSSYPFSFLLGACFLGLIALTFLFERKWESLLHITSVYVVALFINCGYFLGIVADVSASSDLARSGLLYTHQYLHNKIIYIGLTIFLVLTMTLYWVRKDNQVWKNTSWRILFSMLFAGLVALNHQVITGLALWPGHFVQYTVPFTILVVGISLYVIVGNMVVEKLRVHEKRARMCIRWGSIMLVVIVCVMQILAVKSVNSTFFLYQDVQRYQPLLTWLSNTESVCTVFVVEEFEALKEYVTAYTPCDVYHSPYVFSGVPTERVLHNYIIHLRLLGVTLDSLENYLDAHEGDLRSYFFRDWVDKFSDGRDTWVFNTKPEAERLSFISETKVMIIRAFKEREGESIDALLKKYAIEYIVYDSAKEDIPLLPLPYEEVYESEGVRVYSVK